MLGRSKQSARYVRRVLIVIVNGGRHVDLAWRILQEGGFMRLPGCANDANSPSWQPILATAPQCNYEGARMSELYILAILPARL
jgi:hypothetical protein